MKKYKFLDRINKIYRIEYVCRKAIKPEMRRVLATKEHKELKGKTLCV